MRIGLLRLRAELCLALLFCGQACPLTLLFCRQACRFCCRLLLLTGLRETLLLLLRRLLIMQIA